MNKGGLYKIFKKIKNLYKLVELKKLRNRFALCIAQALFCRKVKSCFRKKYKYN